MVISFYIIFDMVQFIFLIVINEMFLNGINWGRVVVFIGFGGVFFVECVFCNMLQLVDFVVDWVVMYMNFNFKDWILYSGGWVSDFWFFLFG